MRGKGFIVLVTAYFVLLPPSALAWSAKGHVVIAEAALLALPSAEQKYFNVMADALLNNDTEQKIKILKNASLKGLSPFAQAAAWPDTRRTPTLKTLFNRYAKADVPTALAAFAPYGTSRWHYVNHYYWSQEQSRLLNAGAKGCSAKPYGDLAKVWRPLLTSFPLAKSDAERGLLVVLLAHLLADAHQPLHTMASVDGRCKSDAGGNGYCLMVKKNGRCQLNLHQLWDGGFSVFNTPIKQVVVPRSRDKLDTATLVDRAIAPMSRVVAQVYSLPKGREPTKAYQIKASILTREQSLAASNALAQLLSALYKESRHAR